MFRVIFDYRTREGFLETDVTYYSELRLAFAFMRNLMSRDDIMGKPVIQRI